MSPQELNAIITEDHAALRWLGARIACAHAQSVALQLFDEFAAVLHRHLSVIDAALAELPGSRLRREFVDTHWYLKRSLVALHDMDRDDEPFHRRLSALLRRLEHQMMAESTELAAALQAPEPAHHAPE